MNRAKGVENFLATSFQKRQLTPVALNDYYFVFPSGKLSKCVYRYELWVYCANGFCSLRFASAIIEVEF